MNNDDHPAWAKPVTGEPRRSDYGYISTDEQLKIAASRREELHTKVQKAVNESNVGATLDMRHNVYGSYMLNAMVAQRLKTCIGDELRNREKTLAPDQQESLDLICTKIGRIINGDPNNIDSWHDIAGYAKLIEDRLNGLVR